MSKRESDIPIIFSYEIDGSGSGIPLTGQAIWDAVKNPELGWVHMSASHPQTRPWLEHEVTYLDPIILDALLADETRPRCVEYGNGVMLILRGINLNHNAEPEEMVAIRLYADTARIISLRQDELKAVNDVEELLQNGKGPKHLGDFIATLCACLLARMEPVLHEMDQRIDTIEEKVVMAPDASLRHELSLLRKQAIMMRRYISPQREALVMLINTKFDWWEENNKRSLRESYDRITRYVEDLDAIRERAQIIKDELSSTLADKLNRNMYHISVIASIFLPLSFLTGLLGINVGGIPGAGDSTAFWTFGAILAGLVAFQAILFKRLGWF